MSFHYVNRKATKLSIHWSTKVPQTYKQDAFFDDLSRAKWISTDFNAKVTYITDKLKKADYPLKSINHIVNDLIKPTNNLEDSYIRTNNLFEEQKSFIWLKFQLLIEMRISRDKNMCNLSYLETALHSLDYVIFYCFIMTCNSFYKDVCLKFEKI